MDNLSDLGAVLRSLEADKITERKRAVAQLQNFLCRPQVVQTLTQHSEEGKKGKLTWNSVLKAAINHVNIETEVLEKSEKAKEIVSKTTQTIRSNKKVAIASIFKFVIRTAEKHGGHIRSTILLNHIIEVMRGDYTRAALGTDYSSILLKNVLGVRKHWLDIPLKIWQELLVLYCQLFLEADCTVNRDMVARLLRVLMVGATQQCDIQPKKPLLFFTEVFKTIREHKGVVVMEPIVGALNVLLRAIAPNARTQVCKLGETILPGVLYLWNNYSSDALKDELVELLLIQMKAHHPAGARDRHSGAFAADWDQWKAGIFRVFNLEVPYHSPCNMLFAWRMKHIGKIYEAVYNELDDLGGRQKFMSGTRPVLMKDSYIELAADVCHQLYTGDRSCIEVTQAAPTQSEGGTPAKKRRLTSGWASLLDTIMSTVNSTHIMPWLQLLGFVLDKYPCTLLEMDGSAALRCLLHVLTTCRGSDVFKLVFACLGSLARSAHAMACQLDSQVRHSMAGGWLQIWTSCLSIISSRQAESDGYQQHGFDLLTTLLQCDLVSPGRQVWNMFLPDVAHPSSHSLAFLATLLASSQIPENHQPSILGSNFTTDKGTFPLRKHLMAWVTERLSKSECTVRPLAAEDSVHTLSAIIVQLTMRNPDFEALATGPRQRLHSTSLEQMYLLTTFDCELDFERQAVEEVDVKKCSTSHVIPVIVKVVEDTLRDVIQQHLQFADSQLKTLEVLACDCSLLSHCMLESQRHHVALSGLEDLLRQTLSKLIALLSEFIKQDGTTGLLPLVQHLKGMVSFPGPSDLACYQTAEMVRGCMPARLTDLLLELVHRRLSKSSSGSRGVTQVDSTDLSFPFGSTSRVGTGRQRILDDFDEFDGEEQANEASMDISFEDEASDSQDEGQQHDSTGVTKVLSPELLSENQTLRNNIVHFLCLLTGHDQHRAPGEVTPAPFDVLSVRRRVEEVLNEDRFDPEQPADLQLMELMIPTLLSSDHNVTDSDLENIMDVLRVVARCQHQDQQVCEKVLTLLACVVPHLNDPDDAPSRVILDCREIMLRLISAFWRLQAEDSSKYNSSVRLALAKCMAVIAQHDPRGAWGTLKLVRPDEEESGPEPTVLDKFPYCLIDSSLSVRLFVSAAVRRLFIVEVKGQPVCLDRKQQHTAFDLLYEICNDIMTIQGRMSLEREQDERLNRTATLLLTVSCVAMASHVCEKKALFALCQAVREKHVDVALVTKILDKMACVLGYPGTGEYLTCHLPFLVSQWLDLQYPLADFPFRLLGLNDKAEFYRNHTRLLIAQQFVRKDMECVQEIVAACEQSVEVCIQDCLPEILVHILPLYAMSKSQQSTLSTSSKRQLNTADKCYDQLVQLLGQEVIDKRIVGQLGKIVVRILGCLILQEPGMEDSEEDRKCEANPPSYSKESVRLTLDYLTQSFSGSTRSLLMVLAKTSDGIERVLLELCLLLWREHRAHERLRALQMLNIFVGMLLQELASTDLGGAWAFTLQRIITTLLHTLDPSSRGDKKQQKSKSVYEEQITVISLHMLKKVCVAVAESHHHQELGKYLGHIVDVASQLAVEDGDVGEAAMELLKLLLHEKADQLQTFIAALDPLPEHPPFADLTKLCRRIRKKAGKMSLEKLVDQILKASRNHALRPPTSFSRTLVHLVQVIDSNKDALTKLSKESRGAENLSRLVCDLLQLTRCSSRAIAEAAGRCLGAIGPISLQTFALPSPQLSPGLSDAVQVFQGGAAERYCHIFHRLHLYLTDQRVDIVELASVTLKKLLATPAGSQFAADYRDKLADRDDLFLYLHPFRSSKHTGAPSSGSERSQQDFGDLVDNTSLWEAQHTDHGRWLTGVCEALLQSGAVTDPILLLLQPVCQAKVEFCELLLPYLVHDIVRGGQPEHREVLSRRFNDFFRTHCTLTSSDNTDKLMKSVCTNKESVLTMLKVVNYLRTQERPAQGGQRRVTAWDNNFWLELDYLNVAAAAQNCAAHFSAILFTEIWCDTQRELEHGSQESDKSGHNLSQSSLLNSLTSLESSGDCGTVQTLLLEALRCTGDPDAIYGCGAGALPDAASRVETYLHEKQWEKAVVTLDIQMQPPTPSTQLGLLKAVQSCGVDYLLRTSLQGLEQYAASSLPLDVAELQYQAAWRAGQWDLDLPQRLEKTAPLHHSLYSCLHAVRDQQPTMAASIINTARHALLQSFDVHLESCRSLYPLLAKLQCLRQSELFVTAVMSESSGTRMPQLLKAWEQEMDTVTINTDFEFVELVQSLQLAFVRLLASGEALPEAGPALQNMLLVAARTARKAGHYQLAERRLHELQVHLTLSAAVNLHNQLEKAQLFWMRSEHTTAKHILKDLITKCQQASEEDAEARRLLPTALGLYGNWLAETRSETPSVIMERYLEKTVQLLESGGDDCGKEAVEGYLSLARFADTQYQNIVNYMSSPTFEAKQALMKKAAEEVEKYRETGQQQKDRYLRTLEKQSKIDQQEVAAMEEDRERFLRHAVRCYTQCLLHGDTHDLRIFRLMSLWFDNSTIADVNSTLQECSEKLCSYKFLPLLHQLAARMGTKGKDATFLATLNKILERAALDHPHHTLWVVLALAHANKDEEVLAQGRSAKRGGRLATNKPDAGDEEDRVQAARSLLEQLKSGSKVAAIVRDMEVLSTAYVQLANWSAEQHRRENKPVPMPKGLSLTSVKNLANVAVPSLDLPVDTSGCYDNIVTIRGYQSTFRLAGGVNLPKIITCQCSDGVDRRQLVKGRDDLRQDAVMQQVFGLVNRLLLTDSQASRRQLHIRTYKVVPLSRRSGLLEWCEGTQPIGEYLVGSPGAKGAGAHCRYRPQDWTFIDCRKNMMQVQTNPDPDKKYKAFMEACKNFQPVFRFFFMEKFLDPAVWFQRRLAYTRSVATNSIVGYILGLGDRHVMNILIDCNSAELIHIDLGVAFEAGHILPTPETVPFRLTRDIVDGMGVTGVEGVFRRCCEKTMEVMRSHQESLMTIVQVLLYDPLSEWTLSPQKALALQAQRDADLNTTLNTTNADLEEEADKSEGQEPVNKLAERVLLRLQQKLQGLEDGVTLSVAGQVNHLIQTARDPHNLSRLFPGWQPYI